MSTGLAHDRKPHGFVRGRGLVGLFGAGERRRFVLGILVEEPGREEKQLSFAWGRGGKPGTGLLDGLGRQGVGPGGRGQAKDLRLGLGVAGNHLEDLDVMG